MNNGAGCAVCCVSLVYIDKPLLRLLVEGGVRSGWGDQKQSKAAEEEGREPALCGQGEETPLVKTSGRHQHWCFIRQKWKKFSEWQP